MEVGVEVGDCGSARAAGNRVRSKGRNIAVDGLERLIETRGEID